MPAPPTHARTAQVGEEIRLSKAEAAHLPGFRYLYQDAGQGVARASPRVKVSAMSHHARMLAAAVRDSLSLGLLPAAEEEDAQWQLESAAGCDGEGAGSAASSRATGSEDSAVLEVLAKSSQDCWAAAWRPEAGSGGCGGRQLLAVRERRSERELAEAGGVMQAFAEQHFLI